MLFKVVKIHGAGMIEVHPNWQWNNISGKIVGIKKLLNSEPGSKEHTNCCELMNELLLNEFIDLRYPQYKNPQRLLCDAYYAGENIRELIH